MTVLSLVMLFFGYIYEDSDSLIVYNDSLTICGQHYYNLKVDLADTARLMIRPWAGGTDSTGWLMLSAPHIDITGSSVIWGNGAGYWGGTNTHANGYGQGYGTAGNPGGGAGGGAGYGGEGGDGGGTPGYGGIAYGSSSDTMIQMGSGGGAGRAPEVDGFGGPGGASVHLRADILCLDSSTVTALGAEGSDAAITAGGGGSGGGIMIWGDSLVLRAVIFSIDGGPGGDVDPEYGFGGGGAGGGRLKAFYASYLDTSDLEITCQGGSSGTGGWGNGQPGMPGSIYFGIQTGILEIVSEQHQIIHVMPNPTRGIICICGTNAFRQIGMYDCCGRSVMTIELTAENQIVNLSDLASGVYFLKPSDNSGQVCKIIKTE